MNNPKLGCMPWCKQGSTRIQALFKYLWYGAGSVPWLSQGRSTPLRGTDMFLLAVWERVVDTTMLRTSANEKQVVDTMTVRTANEKRDVVGTKRGTDQVYHGRFLKTHSRSEYNNTSKRNEKSIVYVSPSIRIPPRVRRAEGQQLQRAMRTIGEVCLCGIGTTEGDLDSTWCV